MNARTAVDYPLTVSRTNSETRRRSVTEATPRGVAHRPKIRSWIITAILSVLAATAIVAWPQAFSPGTTDAPQPRHWAYVLTVEDRQPKSYGPFASFGECDLSLITAMADLNERLPGLYVASPCATASSPATAAS